MSDTYDEAARLKAIFSAALEAADPGSAVLRAVRVEQDRLYVAGHELAGFKRIIVVGAGKAVARMAVAVESLLGSRIAAGLIIVKEGHTAPLSIISQIEAAHPVPDEAGLAGTDRIMQMVRDADEVTLVICLLSGGASALLTAPVQGVTLQDKQQATQLLLNAGASITELNAVRKHLSQVKGGRLSQTAYPAQLVTLILSDVIGDHPDVIASGPAAPDSSTFADALAVINRYGLDKTMPGKVMDYLQRGRAGLVAETVKKHDPCFDRTHNVIVASLTQALAAARQRAMQLGFETRIVSESLQGEARDAARLLAQAAGAELALMTPGERRCLIWGGETTVTVHGCGLGGRNQELALAFAREIECLQGMSLLSAGTDGSDGPTDAAGALVDGATAARARNAGLEPLDFLEKQRLLCLF